MKVKKGSILDQFYEFGGTTAYHKTDICSYVKGIFKGVLLSLVLVALGVLFGVILLEPLIVGVGYFSTGNIDGFYGFGNPMLLIVGVLMWVIIICVAAEVQFKNYLEKHKADKQLSEPEEPKPDSVVKIWWKSVKEKTCFIIERV